MLHLSKEYLLRAISTIVTALQTIICGLYLVLILLPYIAYGLYRVDFSGDMDHIRTPSARIYFPYNHPGIGEGLLEVAGTVCGIVIFILPFFVLASLLCYASGRIYEVRVWKKWQWIPFCTSVALLIVFWSPVGLNILGWILDD